MKKILIFSFTVLAIALFSNNSSAKSINYSISGINVSETADSATAARDIAIAKGQRIAFSILLARMELSQSYMAWVSNEEISQMIQSMQIEGEQLTQNSYSAKLHIKFSKNFIDYTFDKYGIGKSTGNTMYMVVPIQKIDSESYLWSKKNIWMQNWVQVLNDLQIKNIILPSDSIDDIAMIDMNNVDEPKYEDFASIISKYDVDGFVIAEASYMDEDNKIRIVMKDVKKSGTEETKLDYFNVNDLGENELYNKAANKTIKYISGTYISKQKKDSVKSGIDIYVPITELSEWLEIKKSVEEIKELEDVKIVYVTKNLVKINVKYGLSEDTLPGILEDEDLFLIKKFDNRYYLYSSDTNRLFN